MKYEISYNNEVEYFISKNVKIDVNYNFEARAINMLENLFFKLPSNLTLDQEYNYLTNIDLLYKLTPHYQLNNYQSRFLRESRLKIISLYNQTSTIAKLQHKVKDVAEIVAFQGAAFTEFRSELTNIELSIISDYFKMYCLKYLAFLENENFIL